MTSLPHVPDPPAADPAPSVIDEAWLHRDDLVLYARRLLGAHGELAEDVVQEAFLRLHERVAGGRGVREARPWLFRVTRNLALDERRRTRRGEAVRSSLEVVAAGPRGPQEVLLGREDARRALEGVDALPPRERDTVILDQAGLTPPAIARRMQTSTNAVHQSLFRARRRMRDARAAAWGLLPLPFIRLALRAAGSPVLERVPALAPGSGGRLAGGAGLVGLVAAAVIGGGAVVEHPVIPHTGHARHAQPAASASVGPSAPAPAAVSSAGPRPAAVSSISSARLAPTGRAGAAVARSRGVVARTGGTGGATVRVVRTGRAEPEYGGVLPPGDAVDDRQEARRGRETPEREDSVDGGSSARHRMPSSGTSPGPEAAGTTPEEGDAGSGHTTGREQQPATTTGEAADAPPPPEVPEPVTTEAPATVAASSWTAPEETR